MTPDPRTVHTTTTTGPPPARRRMAPARKIALAGGIAYLVTFAASIPQLKLFAAVIADPAGYISNPGGQEYGSTLVPPRPGHVRSLDTAAAAGSSDTRPDARRTAAV